MLIETPLSTMGNQIRNIGKDTRVADPIQTSNVCAVGNFDGLNRLLMADPIQTPEQLLLTKASGLNRLLMVDPIQTPCTFLKNSVIKS